MQSVGTEKNRASETPARDLRKAPRRRLLSIAIAVAGVSALGAAGADTSDDASWIMYNHDAQGTRFNQAEATIGTGNASGLHVKWQYPTPAPVTGTPVVSDGAVYAGDMAGNFYAGKADGK